MKISIRMDDITPDMDWAKFLRFKELCDLYQVKPLIGVVPDNRDELLQIDAARENFWEYILELQREGWVIAQHGSEHIYKTKKMGCFPLNRLSEFAGLSYDEQLVSLKKGQDILKAHGIYTDVFMAPAHSYDGNTLKALKTLGFQRITDGFGKLPYKRKSMTFYPISYRQSSSLKKESGYTTFVVHANTMDDADFARYERLFAGQKENIISYEEYLKIEAIPRGFVGVAGEYIKALTKFCLVNGKSLIRKG